ncbi:hypothetical protein CDAR_257841 [Caerostris darwini]|uniref:Uncharacterized protein n=1 Tax=Caerostris darwini TaxID=1538125 RepID=A0AAV4WUJ0_9ARAC|nr:hypothetical protein CDAR_257841 [Caerostris darwini]
MTQTTHVNFRCSLCYIFSISPDRFTSNKSQPLPMNWMRVGVCKVKVRSEQMMGIGAFPGREIHLKGGKNNPPFDPVSLLFDGGNATLTHSHLARGSSTNLRTDSTTFQNLT